MTRNLRRERDTEEGEDSWGSKFDPGLLMVFSNLNVHRSSYNGVAGSANFATSQRSHCPCNSDFSGSREGFPVAGETEGKFTENHGR